ncbi:hypothetical protein [Caballeronia sp. GAFFF1]|uniref:hypothetical protein n=1 Tax=Caballeronia sp. GAFFF1 TaxID=2921779 RepID=UPI002028D8B5|nr:hypothetical protein [Caballeronia sp. GAFFF1]
MTPVRAPAHQDDGGFRREGGRYGFFVAVLRDAQQRPREPTAPEAPGEQQGDDDNRRTKALAKRKQCKKKQQ